VMIPRYIIAMAGAVSVILMLPVHPVRPAQRLSWATGYWHSPPAWGGLPVSAIDYPALTHVIHYAVLPNSDGTFEPQSLKYVADYAADLTRTAHQNGVRVLISIAQTASGGDCAGATKPTTLDLFISNLMNLVEAHGYDGVDLDWETNVNPEQFTNLVRQLRQRLDARTPRGLLTGAFWEATPYLARVQDAFDQINVMTYDNCSPAEGFSWHNSALYDARGWRRRTVDWRMEQFASRIDRSKLGIGIPFYGYIWTGGAGSPTGGVTAPGQTWTVPPSMRPRDYRLIVSDASLWRHAYKRRQEAAGNIPYLTIDRPGAQGDVFVTYEDEISVSEKVRYAKTRGLGGVMIYELSGDYFPDGRVKHPLLQSVKTAMGMSGNRLE
jgi:chitinase